MIRLPEPRLTSNVSLEEVLAKRRSKRAYKREPLTLEEVSQLLWSAYGVTDPRGFKTTPSAGATYPLVIYLVAGDVLGLDVGVYRYIPETHSLTLIKKEDVREKLYIACLRQRWVLEAPIDIVLTANFKRTTKVYGKRGIRYVWMEFGHASQNVYLQATALGLGTVAVAAFYDYLIKEALGIDEDPGYVMPVGRV